MKPTEETTFVVTPRMQQLADVINKELRTEQNLKDAIKPKVNEFRELMRDTREKMTARAGDHRKRAGEAARELKAECDQQGQGCWEWAIKQKLVIGVSGKPIARRQAYGLLTDQTSNYKPTGNPNGVRAADRKSAPDHPPVHQPAASKDPVVSAAPAPDLGTLINEPAAIEPDAWVAQFGKLEPEAQLLALKEILAALSSDQRGDFIDLIRQPKEETCPELALLKQHSQSYSKEFMYAFSTARKIQEDCEQSAFLFQLAQMWGWALHELHRADSTEPEPTERATPQVNGAHVGKSLVEHAHSIKVKLDKSENMMASAMAEVEAVVRDHFGGNVQSEAFHLWLFGTARIDLQFDLVGEEERRRPVNFRFENCWQMSEAAENGRLSNGA